MLIPYNPQEAFRPGLANSLSWFETFSSKTLELCNLLNIERAPSRHVSSLLILGLDGVQTIDQSTQRANLITLSLPIVSDHVNFWITKKLLLRDKLLVAWRSRSEVGLVTAQHVNRFNHHLVMK